MPVVLVIYDTRTGNTRRAAELIAEGARERGAESFAKSIGEVGAGDILSADAVGLGCPTHFFTATRGMKKFVASNSEALMGKKVAIFTSCARFPGALGWLRRKAAELGCEVVGELAIRGAPKGASIDDCRRLGEALYNAAASAK